MKKLLNKVNYFLARPSVFRGPLVIIALISAFCYKTVGTELDVVRLIQHEADKVVFNLTTSIEKFNTNSSDVESVEPEMVETVVIEETPAEEEEEARCELPFLQPGQEFTVKVGVCQLIGKVDAGQAWVDAYGCNATSNVLRAHAFTPKFNEIECNKSLSVEHEGEVYNFSCAFKTNGQNFGDHIEVDTEDGIVDLETLKGQYDLVTYCCQDHSGRNITVVFWEICD